MTHVAATHVPDENDWLCEGCGYTLNGLPEGGNCPECGKPTQESADSLRKPPLWERPETGGLLYRFVATSLQVLLHPTQFYRSFATRGSRARSRRFAQIHWVLAGILFGIAAWIHLDWDLGMGSQVGRFVAWYWAFPFTILAYAFLAGITRIAGRLTTWEATYRGLRLPLAVVLRGLDYHAAHYLPVAVLALLTVVLNRAAFAGNWATTYLYVLCGEVVVAAAYLFKTYWIGMRNMMYASR